ncbi:MAG TPA: UDP-glucose 4-epimerase GalE [Candidatus Sulfotelmatobacter sp.]|nr:UDP-glucose 4-epimerase GalE [Candidatus Sulfotelmatobacter sp.]
MSTRSKVLVTGGAGFVGSHTVAALLEAGHAVVVLDNLQQGHRQAVPSAAVFVEADLADRDRLHQLFAAHRFDAVLHFAANSLVGESMRDPFRYLGDNVANAVNLVRACCEHGVGKFVLSSTANLFGTPERVPIDEAAAIDPGSPYGESKFATERLLLWAERIFGMHHACLRYFNAAGAHPNGRLGEDHRPETHLIPIVLDAALGRHAEVQIFGDDYPTPDGTCIRDYVHVCDLADAHVRVLDRLAQGSCHYNLGQGEGHSVREVIDTARRVTGAAIPTVVGPRRPGDPARLVAAAERIKRELGWRPRYSALPTIIETAWAWRRRNPTGYPP